MHVKYESRHVGTFASLEAYVQLRFSTGILTLSGSVTLAGEGLACNLLAREIWCEVARVGESQDVAALVCNCYSKMLYLTRRSFAVR